MIARSSRRHRFTLRLVLTVVAALPITVTASDFDGSTDCRYEEAGTDELCGWVELGTHDSGILPAPAETSSQSGLQVTEASSPSPDPAFDSSITAIAAVACASAGVSVEQIVEPFAMVGPFVDDSLASVEKFQSWWRSVIEEAEALQARDESSRQNQATDVQAELDAIAALEPIDIEPTDIEPNCVAPIAIEGLGPSVLVGTVSEAVEDPSEFTATGPLVGSSPMIVTLEESYLPYDLSARDVKLWSVLPVVSHPFCIRSHAYASPLWDEFDARDNVDNSDAVASSPAQVQCGSADCHLEELIWRVENWTAADSPVWAAVEPRNIGQQLATLSLDTSRLVTATAQRLASRWPEANAPDAPSPAGEALLARAGAIEASEIQIAELPPSRVPEPSLRR